MKDLINQIRSGISLIEADVMSLRFTVATADLVNRPDVPTGAAAADRSEMLANCTLAYRHLEDARMRLGKAIQAYDGGVSVYDRKLVPMPTAGATNEPPVASPQPGDTNPDAAAPAAASTPDPRPSAPNDPPASQKY